MSQIKINRKDIHKIHKVIFRLFTLYKHTYRRHYLTGQASVMKVLKKLQ